MKQHALVWSRLALFSISFGAVAAAPAQVCELPTTGMLGANMHQVARGGSMVYTLGGLGIVAIEASDPSNLEIVGEVYSPINNLGPGAQPEIVYDDGFLFVVGDDLSLTGLTGMLVYDTTEPTSPSFAGYVEVPESPQQVAVQGDLAFVTNYRGGNVQDVVGLYVIDISDRTNPAVVSVVEVSQDIEDVVVDGDYVYLATSGPSPLLTPMIVIDVSDPVNPIVASELSVVPGGPGKCYGIEIVNDTAFLSVSYSAVQTPIGLAAVNIANPANPILVSAIIPPIEYISGLSIGALVHSDGVLYQARRNGNIEAYDVANPMSPVFISTIQTDCNAFVGFTVEHGHAIFADGHVDSMDVSSPTAPQLLDRIDPPIGAPHGVALRDNIAFLFDGSPRTFRSIDISDPANPVILSSMELSGGKVVLNGDYAITGGLTVIDISNSVHPEILGSIEEGTGGDFIASIGDLAAYTNNNGLVIASIEDPEHPFIISTLTLPTSGVSTASGGVVMSGDFAYVGRRSAGFYVVDLSDPSEPFIAASVDTNAERMALCGNLLVVANVYYDVEFYDVSNPSSPQFLSEITINSNRCWDLKIKGSLVYRSTGKSGLQIIDASDPMNPSVIGSYLRWTDQIALSETSTFVSIGDDGFHVVDTNDCGLPLGACPPPADPPPPPPPPPAGPADFNSDGFVNGADLAILLANWGGPGGDLNNDGVTDGVDLATLIANWS